MEIRDMDAYSYTQWEYGKVTPINHEVRKMWDLRTKEWFLYHRRTKLLNKSFKQWQNGKVTPINDRILNKFQLLQFRQYILKSYNIGNRKQGKFSVHHLFPRCFAQDKQFDTDLVIPLFKPIHNTLHKKYSNQELLIDPITPVIESLETVFIEAK